MALSGPGAGREVMRSGGQGQHGAANPGNAPAKSTDILRQFGPDALERRLKREQLAKAGLDESNFK